MSEQFQERPSTGELADIVYGPLNDNTEQTLLVELRDGYQKSYEQAVARGDVREIEDAEQRLSNLMEAHPELR